MHHRAGGILSSKLASYLDFLGTLYISAGMERILIYTYPSFVFILSVVVDKAKITRNDVLSLALCYTGVVLMSFSELRMTDFPSLIKGRLLVLGSAFCFACFIIMARRHIKRAGAFRFTAYAMSSASIVGIIQGLILVPQELQNMPSNIQTLGLAMGIGCTLIPSILNNYALSKLPSHESALYGCTGIVIVMILGFTLLGNPTVSIPSQARASS